MAILGPLPIIIFLCDLSTFSNALIQQVTPMIPSNVNLTEEIIINKLKESCSILFK